MKAEEIKVLRKRLKLTQAEFAERLGVSRYTVINWESEHAMPSSLANRWLRLLERES